MSKLTVDESIQYEVIKKKLCLAVETGNDYGLKAEVPFKTRRDVAFLVNLIRKLSSKKTQGKYKRKAK